MKIISVMICSLVFGVFGCRPPNQPAPDYTGRVEGRAVIYQTEFSSLPSEGISVTLDSGAAQAVTDTDGGWELDNVPIGTHIITALKPGFGLTRTYNVQVIRDGLTSVWTMGLFAIPTTEASVDSVFLNTSQGFETAELYVFTSRDSVNGITTFVDSSANAQPSGSHLLMWRSWNAEYWTNLAFLHAQGIRAGTTLYVSACVANWGDGQGGVAGEYFDPEYSTEHVVSPGPKSNVISFKMP